MAEVKWTGPGRNKGRLEAWEGPATNTALWLGRNVVSLLRGLAAREERSVSDVVREAIRDYLKSRNIAAKE